ncbi:LexA family protein [Chryseobacterium sp. DT-3]|uniref:LexA family protein n=1 Tax=Chryseobacterium sp. DT-3 TaxID=3396164 RepID=UPI003F1C5127
MESIINLEVFNNIGEESLLLQTFPEALKAGGYQSYPSAALDFPDPNLDFVKLLIKDRPFTFPGRISGNSLKDIGIRDNDWCLIQKGLEPRPNDLIAVFLDEQYFIKRFKPRYNENNQLLSVKLKSENPEYADFYITEESEFTIWGVITWTFRPWRKL